MTAASVLALCDWAACKELATTNTGTWQFCAKHAEQDRAMQAGDDPDGEDLLDDLLPPRASGHGTEARARQHLRDGEKPCAPCQAAAARAAVDREKRKMTTPTGATGIGLLLEQASAHSSGKVQRLGDKIEGLLDDLRTLMKEAEAQEVVRQEVARLERQLAEARARLRGGKPALVADVGAPPAPSTRAYEPLECRKGCGKVSMGASGRAGHERFCTYEADIA